jgi:hypothetical protein
VEPTSGKLGPHGSNSFLGYQGEGLGLTGVDLFSWDEHETDLGIRVEELEGAIRRSGRRLMKKKPMKKKYFPRRLPLGNIRLFENQIDSIQGWRVRVLYSFVYNALNIGGVILAGKFFGFQKKRTVVILVGKKSDGCGEI